VALISLAPPFAVGATFNYVDGAVLVAVPHGPFVMGHGTADNPEHTETLSDFWIYATEVTNRQYSVCVAQGQCAPPDVTDNPLYAEFGHENDPVVGVTYGQARAYCNFLNADLPTEAQWEKTARGSDALVYPWGDAAPSCELLNFNNCLKHTDSVTGSPKGRSPYGALNMSGNVYEWVQDWYDPVYYENSPPGDPQGPDSGLARGIRSSGYRSTANQSLTYARSFASPADHRRDLGFRCAVQGLSYFAPACQLAGAVAPAGLAAASIDCPNISIGVQASACRYGGGAVVTFSDDHPLDPNASFGGIVGCTLLSGRPGSFPLTYSCRQGSTAVMSSSCMYSGIAGAQCPAHFSVDLASGICKWDGSPTSGLDCPAGEFYDPAYHCCMITTGKLSDFAVCPVGTVFTETGLGQYACLPADSVRTVPPQSKSINPPDCPNNCDLTIELCGARNLVFCSTTCACLSVGVKCPTH
jgi:formylglycine-generating enzyme required for sulfatase activity